jgi:putative PIN family toxin of toxin-antitoxin system
LFRDPRCDAIRDALGHGVIEAVISARCRDEFEVVLAQARWDDVWRQRNNDDLDRATLQVQLRASTREVEVDLAAPALAHLPVCRDKHDQKFLQLAAASHAHGLITKDRDLLKLARRMRVRGCIVTTPQEWSAA